MKINNYICHLSYHRNIIVYDHDFWYTCVKWWYLQVIFFFKILIFCVVSGVKWQKMAQNHKIFWLLHFISLKPYIIWLSFMVHLCKMMMSPGVVVIFKKIVIFWLVRGVKGQNITRKDKKFCLLHFISQEPYIIWLSFMLRMCKMLKSFIVFFFFFFSFFQNFNFLGF